MTWVNYVKKWSGPWNLKIFQPLPKGSPGGGHRSCQTLSQIPPKDHQTHDRGLSAVTDIDITTCPCCNIGKMQLLAEIPSYRAWAPNHLAAVAAQPRALIFKSSWLKTNAELRPDFALISLKQNSTQQKYAFRQIISMNLFLNCLLPHPKRVDRQIGHTSHLITIPI